MRGYFLTVLGTFTGSWWPRSPGFHGYVGFLQDGKGEEGVVVSSAECE